jgi:hypothetical protein
VIYGRCKLLWFSKVSGVDQAATHPAPQKAHFFGVLPNEENTNLVTSRFGLYSVLRTHDFILDRYCEILE